MSYSQYTALFRPLSSEWPKRSSHAIALLPPSHGIVFGGELEARTPVPSTINALALLPGSNKSLNLGVDGPVPCPRVGATLVQAGETYYVWGGRGGKDMAPLEGDEAGVYTFNVTDATVHWRHLKGAGDVPQGRSYHSAALLGNKLYIHAGCPTQGRLADLYSFDLSSNQWTRAADAPSEPRGGTALAATTVSLCGKSESVLLRWGGFAGHELGGDNALDIYLPSSNTWQTVHPSTPDGAPGPRSVHGFLGVNLGGPGTNAEKLVAVMFMGERDPSALGHAGAGSFWDDVWGLAQQDETFIWRKLEIAGKPPAPRGWFAYADCETGSSEKGRIARILVHGGLLSSNERSGEAFLLEVVRRA